METTIDAAGRVVIPKPLRDHLGLSAGRRLLISARDGRIEIEPTGAEVRLEKRAGRLVAVTDEPVETLTTDQVRDILDDVRR